MVRTGRTGESSHKLKLEVPSGYQEKLFHHENREAMRSLSLEAEQEVDTNEHLDPLQPELFYHSITPEDPQILLQLFS